MDRFVTTSVEPILPVTVGFTQSPETPIVLETSTGLIYGSLTQPSNPNGYPVVLIVAGSGPTDRDGNNRLHQGKNDSLKMLAQALAVAGIPSVRYDKRGIGDSVQTPEEDLLFDSYVQDAIGWVDMLKRDTRFTGVAVVGHSEGSLIGMVASRFAASNAFVSIAGPAQNILLILKQQLAGKLPADLAVRSDAILNALERGEFIDDVPTQLNFLYRRSVQPYIVSWLKYTPTDELKRLKIPVLVLQGDADFQVGVDQAHALKAANPEAELVVIHGMNHVLKQVPPEQDQPLSSYSDPDLPLSAELVDQIIRFLASVSETEISCA